MVDIPKCIICDALIDAKDTGRPALYCSNACRMKAKRRRRTEAVFATLAGDVPEPDLGDVSAEDLLGPRARDPDGAVLESILLARAAAAAFGVSARRARPQLSWRCVKMADHIAGGLRRYFTVKR